MRLAVEKSVWTRPAWAWEPQTPTTPPPLSSFRTKEDNDFSARSLFPILLPSFPIQHRIESDRNRHPIDPKPWESKRRDGFAAADWIRAQLEFRKRRERERERGGSIDQLGCGTKRYCILDLIESGNLFVHRDFLRLVWLVWFISEIAQYSILSNLSLDTIESLSQMIDWKKSGYPEGRMWRGSDKACN